ncbi:MAG: hypothetical protein Q9219_001628 [cf. Caloplaca sp. 3 TL-2023]
MDKHKDGLLWGTTKDAEQKSATESPLTLHGVKPSTAVGILEQQRQPILHNDTATIVKDDNSVSLAVASLRKLSVEGPERQGRGSPEDDERTSSKGGLFKSLLNITSGNTSDLKPSAEASKTSDCPPRRRSSAFRDGNRRRPRKDDIAAPLTGLGVPATIILRKATGLFRRDSGSEMPAATTADETASSREGSLSSPTMFTLVGFDSHLVNDQKQHKRPQEELQRRRRSTVSTNGQELLLSTNSPKSLELESSGREGSAGRVVTITKTFPSPAIITSPVTSSSPANGPEGRFSIVQIKSRHSLHQVIWREDDTSSGSGSSSEHLSPTGSIKVLEENENSPVHQSAAPSKLPTRQNSKTAVDKGMDPVLETPVKNGADMSLHSTVHRPEGQMLQWSWSSPAGIPFEFASDDDVAKDPKISSRGKAPPNGPSVAPQILVPEGDEESWMTSSPSGIARRGSFMVSPPSQAGLAVGRELGSRRSISVQALPLSGLAELGATED